MWVSGSVGFTACCNIRCSTVAILAQCLERALDIAYQYDNWSSLVYTWYNKWVQGNSYLNFGYPFSTSFSPTLCLAKYTPVHVLVFLLHLLCCMFVEKGIFIRHPRPTIKGIMIAGKVRQSAAWLWWATNHMTIHDSYSCTPRSSYYVVFTLKGRGCHLLRSAPPVPPNTPITTLVAGELRNSDERTSVR